MIMAITLSMQYYLVFKLLLFKFIISQFMIIFWIYNYQNSNKHIRHMPHCSDNYDENFEIVFLPLRASLDFLAFF